MSQSVSISIYMHFSRNTIVLIYEIVRSYDYLGSKALADRL